MVRALVERGAGDLEAGRIDAAVEAFDEVDRCFGDHPSLAVRRWVSSGLGLRAVGLGRSGRLEEAIAGLEAMAQRFEADSEDPEVRKQLACALFNKGLAFVELGRSAGAVAAFDDVVANFGNDASPDVQAEVAGALENKARLLVTKGRAEAAVAAVDEFDRRFGAGDLAPAMQGRLASALILKATVLLRSDQDAARAQVDRIVRMVRNDPRPEVRREGVNALDAHARGLAQVGDLDAAADVFGEIVTAFDSDEEMAYDVASALYNRGIALRDADRLAEAAVALDRVATEYEANADPKLRRMSIRGLFNKAIVLANMIDTAAALDALDTVIRRFGDEEDPELVDWVRRSHQTAEDVRLLGLHSAGRVPTDADTAAGPPPAADADLTGPIEQMRQLEATGDLELALELGTERRRELTEQAHAISLLELDSERGWLQLKTGDTNIAEITLGEVYAKAWTALGIAEATLAHNAETYGLWKATRRRGQKTAIAYLEFALQLRAGRVEDAAAYLGTLERLGETIERAGRLRQVRGQLVTQIEQLDAMAAVDVLPERPRLLTILAELSFRQGHTEAAEAAARQALEYASQGLGINSTVAKAAQGLLTHQDRRRPSESRDAALCHAASTGLRLLEHDWVEHLDELEALESQGRTADALELVGRLSTEAEQEPALRLAEVWLLWSAGNDRLAMRRFEDAYEAAYETWSRLEEVVSRTANSLGLLFGENTGDTTAAIEFLTIALRRRANRDEDRYLYAQTLANLGVASEVSYGDNARARLLVAEAVERVERIPEAAHRPERAEMLITLAGFHRRQDEAIAAETASRTAIQVAEATLPQEHPVIAAGYRELAAALRAQGRSAEARVYAVQAVTMLEIWDSDDLSALAHARVDLAELLIENGDVPGAIVPLRLASRVLDLELLHNLELVPIDERLAMTLADRHRLDLWLSLVRKHGQDIPGLPAAALDSLERRKTMGAQVSLALREADAATPHLEPQRQRLRALRRKGTDRLLHPHAEDDDELDSLRREVSALETSLSWGRRIAMMEPSARDRVAQQRERIARWMSPSAFLSTAIEPGRALIEYVRYREPEADRYLAFVHRGGDDAVAVFDIGEADHIDSLVRDYLTAMATDGAFLLAGGVLDGGLSVTKAQSLRAAVVDPVLGALGTTRRLFVVPDGVLAAVPFQALNDDTGGYVIDRFEITYLASAGDLLHTFPVSPPPGPPVVFADPDFDLASPYGQTENPFPRLHWTAAEGRRLGDLLGVPSVAGPEATEAVLLACERPRVLHIATHGWFLPAHDHEGERPPWMSHPRLEHLANLTYMTRPGDVVLGVNAEFSSQLYGQLFVRCGLATAGFNTAWAGRSLPEAAGDGLLTGADVAALDLYGTELVVLSACETGLGQAVDFEGIHGLRRAFEMAGAAAIVTALWQVADEGTARFMGEFYERLIAGAEPATCLHETQVSLRRVLPHPYFWGGFVCQGAARSPAAMENVSEQVPWEADELALPANERGTGGGRVVQEAAEAGSARSEHNVAVGLHERGLLDEAEIHYRRAAAAAHAPSANNLGELLWGRDDLDGAREWLGRALDLGYEPAAATLGHVSEARGDNEEAERMWRRAARSDALSALKLAELLHARGDTTEAVTWWRRAAENGLTLGALRFGAVLLEMRDYEESQIWLRRAEGAGSSEAVDYLEQLRARREMEAAAQRDAAAQTDDPQAAVDLGVLAAQRGDEAEALRWWRTAAAGGHRHATQVLARLLATRGETREAEALLRPLAAQDDTKAAHVLGILLFRRGEPDEAENWLRRAARGGEIEAKTDLALLLWKRAQPADAERLLTEAAEAGSDEAARNLAAALEEAGRYDDAARWWRVSAEAGNSYAAYGLGGSLYRRGEFAEAERWFRRAAVAGELPAMSSLGRLLAVRGDPEAEEWLRRSADAGTEGDGIVLSQILTARGEREPAKIWWQRALAEAKTKDGTKPQ